jgi:dinuclear metal center YbgI/SA1388 family protein|tara:strand:+ start:197 stop:952 length:756 start_codon:yes stop_codon:yes gene_type:complete
MVKLKDIVLYLDGQLKISEIPDYPGALNGLQLHGGKSIRNITSAVDAALPVIREAVRMKSDLLIVHHGMFWGGAQKIEGALYEKLKLAMAANMAIYSCHIPLDIHPKFGNNVLLAKAIGLSKPMPFLEWQGIRTGLRFKVDMQRKTLLRRIEKAVGGPVHLAPGATARVKHIGLITGGAGSQVAAAATTGIDTFITGEGPHHTYTLAEELGINLIYAGHYATETFGVQALAGNLAKKYGARHTFIDHPTGL